MWVVVGVGVAGGGIGEGVGVHVGMLESDTPSVVAVAVTDWI